MLDSTSFDLSKGPVLDDVLAALEPDSLPPGHVPPRAVLVCTIKTYDGHYLTAVSGGGRNTDVIHTDATQALAWETFTLWDSGDGNAFIHYGVQTVSGHFLTAVAGGGRNTDVIHSDATQIRDWEKFTFLSLGDDLYAIQTIDGHYLTATGAGGQAVDAIHSDATRIDTWEMFRLSCEYP